MKRQNCGNCWHFRDGESCRLYSCTCATALFNHRDPTRWMSMEEGERIVTLLQKEGARRIRLGGKIIRERR